MLLSSGSNIMGEGDLVILYFSPTDMHPITICSSEAFQHRLGRFPHSTLLSLPFGSRIIAMNSTAYAYALRPTTDLWTRVLPHRTQILYHADVAFIIQKLGIREGSVVVESGTGSGSFTHSLARAVAPFGKVHTFDFHEQRARLIREQFKEHKLDHLIHASHRDVCKDGFDLEHTADCVFLDLPAPWDAIKNAKQALKSSQTGRICCFSPCIEQVSRTVQSLQENGFVEIEMYSCLLKEYDVKRLQMAEYPERVDLPSKRKNRRIRNDNGDNSLENDSDTLLVSVPKPEMRGHTSFLTFASLVPNITNPC